MHKILFNYFYYPDKTLNENTEARTTKRKKPLIKTQISRRFLT